MGIHQSQGQVQGQVRRQVRGQVLWITHLGGAGDRCKKKLQPLG